MSVIRCLLVLALIFAFAGLIGSISTPARAFGLTSFSLINQLGFMSETSAAFQVIPEDGVQNPDGCSRTDAYESAPGEPGHNQRLSLALSAFITGREARFVIDGCTSSSGRPAIKNVVVR